MIIIYNALSLLSAILFSVSLVVVVDVVFFATATIKNKDYYRI